MFLGSCSSLGVSRLSVVELGEKAADFTRFLVLAIGLIFAPRSKFDLPVKGQFSRNIGVSQLYLLIVADRW